MNDDQEDHMATPTGLGHSLELRDGDLVFEDGRPARISGLPNLAQALTLRVLTPLGGDRFATTYGLDVRDVFTRAASVRQAQDLLRLSLVRTLATDRRVREIRDIAVLDPPPGAGRRLWRFEVTIVAADGGQHTLPFGVEV
ncbi:hypothetical protein [Bailinhaonella thermotolerans]|uniref:IraD/Gp25-like domain-containing protein n=1 Tax=Bailinhaonella thermotolerans TaxID=1070861 RepID=A0A3A4AXP9_9ACTN|nr:hypothetical protein [Bailinhaonella thermotolerans]RJL35442.1 hypothetical protein D5H75_01100 [Bailinhaonella thermotolerans]